MTLQADRHASLHGEPLIEVRNASRYFETGGVRALDQVTCLVHPGEHVAIVGKSGSGKTTLLNLIGGLDRPTEGEVWFAGKRLGRGRTLDEHRRENVGFVFQSYYLLPNLTAGENVQVPMFGTGLDPGQRLRRAHDLLHQVGLSARVDHLPYQLSGGECQRVAIARAMANQPSVVLADEPTGALDEESGRVVLDELGRLHQDQGLTLIVVTHDEAVAALADRRIRLVDGRAVETD
jgi:ABC-type lipoprotein export system ATPase subunit